MGQDVYLLDCLFVPRDSVDGIRRRLDALERNQGLSSNALDVVRALETNQKNAINGIHERMAKYEGELTQIEEIKQQMKKASKSEYSTTGYLKCTDTSPQQYVPKEPREPIDISQVQIP